MTYLLFITIRVPVPATKETSLKEEGQQFLRIIQISYIKVTYLWRDLKNFTVSL